MSHFQMTGLCVPSQHAVSRRGFLSDGALRTAGAVGVAGCFAADMGQIHALRSEEVAAELKKQDKRVILLWLAGGAYKLREGTLAVADFLARLKDLPRSFQGDAVLIIERYAGSALTDQVAALTDIVRSCPSDVLPEWIALLPADPAIEAALLERIKATATARLLVIPLALRQVDGGPAWRAMVQRLAAAAPAVLGVLSDDGGGAPRGDAPAGGLP